MAVGLRVHWKQPIAYFSIDKLSAEVQLSLVRDAITEMAERGFTEHATVCDGNHTNKKNSKSVRMYAIVCRFVFSIFTLCDAI